MPVFALAAFLRVLYFLAIKAAVNEFLAIKAVFSMPIFLAIKAAVCCHLKVTVSLLTFLSSLSQDYEKKLEQLQDALNRQRAKKNFSSMEEREPPLREGC